MSDRAAFWCGVAAYLSLAVFLGAYAALVLRPRPAAPAWHIEACSGCGTEWRSPYPQEPIDRCPNCPMSEEEFERLKESVRNRNKGGGR